ncbi:MAG: CD1247 N-terminal domain-containing protein [bacterium]
MGDLMERIAYLQGLAAGLELREDSKEGKLIGQILEILEEMAEELEFLTGQQEEMNEYLSAVDESLGELEDDYYGEEGFTDEEDDYIEVECPDCGERVYFEEEVLDEDGIVEITCPNCGVVVFSTEETDEDDENDEYELEEGESDLV